VLKFVQFLFVKKNGQIFIGAQKFLSLAKGIFSYILKKESINPELKIPEKSESGVKKI